MYRHISFDESRFIPSDVFDADLGPCPVSDIAVPSMSFSDQAELNEWIDNLRPVTIDELDRQWAAEQVRRDEESATVPPEHTVEYDDAFGIADVVRYMPSDPAEQVKVIDAMMDKLEALRDSITHAENHRKAGEFVDSLQAMIRGEVA